MHSCNEDVSLSHKSKSLWAKTGSGEYAHEYEPLYVHMVDAAEVADLIWEEWLSKHGVKYLSEAMGLEPDEARWVVKWIVMVHDIGKATPAFQRKVPERAEAAKTAGLGFASNVQSKSYQHAMLGELILTRWLVERRWNRSIVAAYVSVVGNHHGMSSKQDDMDSAQKQTKVNPNEILGDAAWRSAQDELLEFACDYCGLQDVESVISTHRLNSYAQILLTGIVIMADWISSNTDLFPLVHDVDEDFDFKARASEAWHSLDMPGPWHASRVTLDPDELFSSRFGERLPADASMRATQRSAVELAMHAEKPGLFIVEAPMGMGKTELALMCAEVLAGKFNMGGVGVFLPTMATSNAMFMRVLDWVRHMPTDGAQSIRLFHSKASLNNDYASLSSWGSSWMGDEPKNEEGPVAHQWFSGSKKGLLASFVIGTVDQLLMAALRTKHAHLRHLGLSGKVVIIDEVHAYDAYMSVYLDRALAFLGRYAVPVILLSATLPPSRRNELMRAYCGMRKKSRKYTLPEAPRRVDGAPTYPLVTFAPQSKDLPPQYVPCEEDGRVVNVLVERMNDDDKTLIETVSKSIAQGGCICVLRDTVRRAQETYELLKSALSVDVVLAHSRFIACDRMSNDDFLVKALGANQDARPQSLVVVATQVVEQSLDIDFDLLITDVAPVDMLLQRMGRLHRHVRGEGECLRPPALRRARCIVTGVEDWDVAPPKFAEGITSVYQPAILMRTLLSLDGLLQEGRTTVCLPTQIAPLVELVYEDGVSIPESWMEAYGEAQRQLKSDVERKTNDPKGWLLGKPSESNLDEWIQGAVRSMAETVGRAAVRDSEESLEVVLVRVTERGPELLPWVAEQYQVPASLGDGTEPPNDESARVAAFCTVALPQALSRSERCERVAESLVRAFPFSGWQESRWLRGALPLGLDDGGEVSVDCVDRTFTLRYDKSTGLRLIKNQEVTYG